MSEVAKYERALRLQRAEAMVRAFQRWGIHLRIVGEDLRWFARVGVVATSDLEELKNRKSEVLTVLRDELRGGIEERAAVLQFDAGLFRAQANRQAMAEATA